MEINKVQWRMIAKGEKLPCDSFLMRKDGTMTSMVTGAGVTVGQDAYYLPVEELRSLPKEENKDERMIQYFKDLTPFDKAEELYEKYGFSHKDAIAWLEKQGKQKSIDELTPQETMDIAVAKCFEQGEQKPADKVEQKFKVGDWVIYDHRTYQIVELPQGRLINASLSRNGKTEQAPLPYCEKWSIQDAKDGDVLASNRSIFIFSQEYIAGKAKAHCGIMNGLFIVKPEGCWTNEKCYPATKEQRDTLLKAMTDAGYAFDFEKKKLKKIEQKPTENKGMNLDEEEMTPFQKKVFCIIDTTIEEEQGLKQVCDELLRLAHDEIKKKPAWSEEDEKFFKTALWHISYSISNGKSTDIHCDTTDWLKSLKDRVQLQQKQEWNEEDERILNVIINDIQERHPEAMWKINCGSTMAVSTKYIIDWLKSLRPQNR